MPKPSTGTATYYMKRHAKLSKTKLSKTIHIPCHPTPHPMCNAWALPIAIACFGPCCPCFGNVKRQLTSIILAALESPPRESFFPLAMREQHSR